MNVKATTLLMAAAHKRARSVSKARPMRLVSGSGVVVSGSDTLACAVAAMASDETRRYGRLARTARRQADAAARAASATLNAAVAIQSLEGMYSVAGKRDEWQPRLDKAVMAALEADRSSDAAKADLALVETAHSAWSRFVIMPDDVDSEAHPSRAAYAYAAKARRTRLNRVSMPETRNGRVVLEWESDATRDALDLLRRALLKRSPLAVRRASTPSASPDPIDAARRASMRQTRYRNRTQRRKSS